MAEPRQVVIPIVYRCGVHPYWSPRLADCREVMGIFHKQLSNLHWHVMFRSPEALFKRQIPPRSFDSDTHQGLYP